MNERIKLGGSAKANGDTLTFVIREKPSGSP